MNMANLYLILIGFNVACSSAFENECSEGEILSSVSSARDSHWRWSNDQFRCISRCQKVMLQQQLRKPLYLERIFYNGKTAKNCMTEERDGITIECSLKSICLRKLCVTYFIDVRRISVHELQMKSLKDYPLFYFEPEFKLSRFEAEKFCSKHGLIFGVVQNETQFLENLMQLTGHQQTWSSKIEKWKTLNYYCVSLLNDYQNIFATATHCKEKLSFVCSLPTPCHTEICSAPNCTESGTCSRVIQERVTCTPECNKIQCDDEIEDYYGFKAIDGDLFTACGSVFYVSKAPFLQASARKLCCAKSMQLLGIEDKEKKFCLRKELQNLKASSSFWTSGSSTTNCSKKFAWCGFDEIVDFEGLQLQRLTSKPGNECLAFSTLLPVGEELVADDCKIRRRVICQRLLPARCKNISCPNLQYNNEKKVIAGMYLLNKKGIPPGVLSIKACKKEIRIGINVHMNYYKATRFGYASGNPLMSFPNKEKIDCITSALLEDDKVPTGKYWVSLMSIGCTTIHRWCNAVDNPPFEEYRGFIWKKGEPSVDPMKECVAVEFQRKFPYLTFMTMDCNSLLWGLSELKDTQIKL